VIALLNTTLEGEKMSSILKLLILPWFLGACILSVCSVSVHADWNPNEPAKYLQMPDALHGLDVNATYWETGVGSTAFFPKNKMLADDFPCYVRDKITDIHIWGSWLNDVWVPDNQISSAVNLNTSFKLSIFSDVPAGVDVDYSHPGDLLWSQTFSPGQYTYRTYGDATEELFYDPNTNQIIGSDTRIWQYNFDIDPATAFEQKGLDQSQNPTIYWLAVQAIVPVTDVNLADNPVFGWKTTAPVESPRTLYDDAVFADSEIAGGPPVGPGTGATPWVDMYYPNGTYYAPQSLDLAFAITPEPGTFLMLALAGAVGVFMASRRRKA
jgi:hypothetical protein